MTYTRPPDNTYILGHEPPSGGMGPLCPTCGLSTWVELGGGPHPSNYHPNCDLRAIPEVDIVCDLNKGIPLHDGHAERLKAIHFLQHLRWPEVVPFLKDALRVLKPGGSLFIFVTDLDYVFERVQREGFTKFTRECIWGEMEHIGDFHQCGFNQQSMIDVLLETGFNRVEFLGWCWPWEIRFCAWKGD